MLGKKIAEGAQKNVFTKIKTARGGVNVVLFRVYETINGQLNGSVT